MGDGCSPFDRLQVATTRRRQMTLGPQCRADIHGQPKLALLRERRANEPGYAHSGLMTKPLGNLLAYRELIFALAIKNITLRYKQAYFGVAWTVLQPLLMMGIFMLVRAFIGIDSGGVPYPVLAFAALLIWKLFQETANEGVNSIVGNAHLIRKIYFPREVFPLTAAVTKLIEFGINFAVLLAMMAWFGMFPTVHFLWVPLIVCYAVLVAWVIAFAGSAINVRFRDVGAALPVLLSLVMYASPIIYPMHLVRQKLLEQQGAGAWSEALYLVYAANPVAGLVDSFQRVMLSGKAPDLGVVWPGLIVTLVALAPSYWLFKRAEATFADLI